MQLRLLDYFVALAREKHFARAAEACNVTQPTLSAGIAALEEQVGKRLVHRERRFIGLTPEGHAMLPWAQQLIATYEGMSHAVETARGPLRGALRLGAIPASAPVIGYLARTLAASYPEVSFSIRSLTSREIEHGLANFELDAGLTYLDHEPLAHVVSVPLYAERSMFVARRGMGFDDRDSIAWSEVLDTPLCLLHQGMQNRRILDAHLAARGLTLHPRAVADSYVALLAMVESGGFTTIMPDSYGTLVTPLEWARLLPFSEPVPRSRIGLIVADRTPLAPLALAALSVAGTLRLPPSFAPA